MFFVFFFLKKLKVSNLKIYNSRRCRSERAREQVDVWNRLVDSGDMIMCAENWTSTEFGVTKRMGIIFERNYERLYRYIYLYEGSEQESRHNL